MKKLTSIVITMCLMTSIFLMSSFQVDAAGTAFDTPTVLPSTDQLRIYFDETAIAAYLTGAGTGSDIDIITSDGGTKKIVINRYNLDGGIATQSLEINGTTIMTYTYSPFTDYSLGLNYADGYIDVDTSSWSINERNIHSVSAAATTLSLTYEDMDPPYTVTFDSNGGSAVSPQEKHEGETIVRPSDPTKDDHVFVGWYKTEALRGEWRFNIDEMPGEDITLYAKWRIEIEPGINNWLEDSTLNTSFGKTMISLVIMSIVLIGLALLKAPPPVLMMVLVILFLMFLVFEFVPQWIAIVLTILLFAFLYISIKGNGGVVDDN